MEEKIKDLEGKLREVTEKWKRAAADYANLEKRVEKEKEAIFRFVQATIISQFLPILDSLVEAERKSQDSGFSLILKQFKDLLEEQGVEEIKGMGEKLDPLRHEAVEVVRGADEDKVVEILRSGYKIGDKVIRPAQVKVKKREPNRESERAEREGAKAGDYV